MEIDNRVLEKLENLSYLKIDEEKRDEVIEQLSKILEYVENLNELDTSNIDSYFSILENGTPLREDIPQKDESVVEIILKHAPQTKDDFFIVPAIIG
ncbi:MAG: Asp-tRNA(Asn)/Glu-tRNA(Gln) amidotransferase subunit GatC [Epsilonproteobacteria bacterium]|nr:Asp-tRNA(Asn)/Glu-tRNA(Gln) amidotransferase subunit GatC [Campylobacterota bacterium]